jgi:hypothetical protein
MAMDRLHLHQQGQFCRRPKGHHFHVQLVSPGFSLLYLSF